MKRVSTIVAAIIVLVVLGLLAWLVFGGINYLISTWPELEKTTATLALTLIATTLVSAWIIGRGPLWAARENSAEGARRRRTTLYLQLLELWTTDIAEERQDAWDDSLWRAERELALCGTRNVVAKYIEFRKHARAGSDEVASALGEMVNAMRKDLHPLGGGQDDLLVELILNDGNSEPSLSKSEEASVGSDEDSSFQSE